MSVVRAGAWRWPVQAGVREDAFFERLELFTRLAADEGVEWLVYPELFVLELLGGTRGWTEATVPHFLSRFAPRLESALSGLAKRYGMTIVGGSHYRREGDDVVHMGVVAEADGSLVFQPKNNGTVYERDVWKLPARHGLARFRDPRLGLTVCYDSEFPEAVRKLAEAGVECLCVPAYTETVQGFQRVRWCCLSRAVENQIFVIHASLGGSLEMEPLVDTQGTAAIIAPSVRPFPDEAVLSESMDLAVADLDFDALHEARETGSVRNWHDRNNSAWRWL